MFKLAIVCPSDLPLPATKGGAVETGIQQIIDENEKCKLAKIEVFSYFNNEAYDLSKKYRYTLFHYYRNKNTCKSRVLIRRILNKLAYIMHIGLVFNLRPDYVSYIGEILSKRKYDAILIKNAEKYVLPLSKYTSDTIILQLHNDFLNGSMMYAKRIIRRCAKIVVNSQYIKRRVLTVPGIKEENIFVNMNCLDGESTRPVTSKEKKDFMCRYNMNNSSKKIVYVGRLIKEKGVKELLQAAVMLPKNIDWELVIAGSSWFGKTSSNTYIDELRQISFPIKDRIRFLGYLPHYEVRKVYAIADVAVVPSIWEEPAGRVVLEAQAMGAPLVVSDAGGILEYAAPGTAYISERGDNYINSLSDNIYSLIKKGRKKNHFAVEYAKKYDTRKYYKEIMTYIGVKNEKE